jgi:DNA primase
MSSTLSNSLLDDVTSKIDIVDLVSEYIVLKKSGSNYQGLCPFHKEKTPSFIVNQQKQIFRCFGCGVGGNIFEFYKKYHNVSFKEALQSLALRVGIDIKNEKLSSKEVNLRSQILEIYKLSVEFYKWLINHKDYGTNAINYLNSRNINKEVIDKFKIGYSANNWNSLYLHLKNKFSQDELKESGLFLENSNGELYDRFRNRIMFPIQNDRGETIAFGGRIIDELNQYKYINSPETLIYTKGDNLYALDIAKNYILKKGYLILVEGYFDVIRCHLHGFENTIASLGTALTHNQGKKILKYAKKIIIAYDSDSAGQLAIDKSFSILKDLSKTNNDVDIYVLEIPEGKDPDEFLNSQKEQKFQLLIENSKSYFDFKIDKILSSWDIENENSKKHIFDKCVEILSQIEHPIYLNQTINKIVNFKIKGIPIGFDEKDIRRRLKLLEYKDNKELYYKKNFGINLKKINNDFYIDNNKRTVIQKTLEDFKKIKRELKAEQGIIHFMIERYKAINYIKEKLEHIKFSNETNEKIKQFIFENSTIENPLKWNDLLKNFTESEEQSIISEICSLDIDIKSDKLLKDYIKVVKSSYLNFQKEELKNEINEILLEGNTDIINSLLEVYSDLQKDIENIKLEIFSGNL